MPASAMAAILSSALPEPPEIIAPACPIRRPAGRGLARDKSNYRFLDVSFHVTRCGLFRIAADFANHDDGVRVRILIEEPNASL